MIPVRVFHQNITNKCDDDTNEEMFMINRCVPSAYIFSVSSMDHTVYCQYRIGLSRVQNDKIKHSSWTSIITAAKYLEHLPDNVQEDSIYKTIFYSTKLMHNGLVEDACYMLSDMAIYAYSMDCNHGRYSNGIYL